MNIKEKFLELTKNTYPIGTEKNVYKFLSEDFIKDQFDNLYYIIGESNTLFCAHLDTVGPAASVPVTHVIEDNMIKTDGKTILGADDKAGVVIMLEMIERKVPGFYLFTVGEEKGCVGSSKISKRIQDNQEHKYDAIKKIVAFDRRGYDCVITHQLQQRCCSDQFADALISELSKFGFTYKKDPTGMYCDSAEFGDIISECTNISVGYFDQHSVNEKQDIDFLTKLADACCKIDWQSLPAVRDPKKVEYVDTYLEPSYSTQSTDIDTHPYNVDFTKAEIIYFKDKKFDFISNVSILNDQIVDITLKGERCEYEVNLIAKYLADMDIQYDKVLWDGLILDIYHDKQITKLTRNDILEYMPELDIDEIKK